MEEILHWNHLKSEEVNARHEPNSSSEKNYKNTSYLLKELQQEKDCQPKKV